MEIEQLMAIIEEMDKSNITNFQYKDNKLSVKITKQKRAVEQHDRKQINEIACSTYDDSIHVVKSEHVGIVKLVNHRNNNPFIVKDQKIDKGDLLCIIEQLRVHFEVRANISGYIKEICVENNSIVDYLKKLFIIKEV